MTIIYFIIALGVLVLVHEWGHFIVARKSGIRVEQFSIGFGPKIFSMTRGGTEYKVSILPLGGFVKLYGENPEAEAEGDEAKAQAIANAPDAFSAAPLRNRLATVFAGPVMNLVLCLILMPLVFMIGRMVPVILEEAPVVLGVQPDSPAQKAGLQKGDHLLAFNGEKMPTWTEVLNWIVLHPGTDATVTVERDGAQKEIPVQVISSPFSEQEMGYVGIEPQFFWGNDPIVGELSPNSPAEKAGLQPGDRIVALNGKPIESWTDMTDTIRGGEGKEVDLTYTRGETRQTVKLAPMFHEGSKAWVIGITKYTDPNSFVKKRYGFTEAVQKGLDETWKLFRLTGDVLARLFSFNLSYKALGGPLQIAQATGAAARSGLGEFLYFLSFLSLQLGVLNLLPIPVLDGGHVLFMAIEGVRRKPVSVRVRNALTQVGMVFLLGLMILITINDIDRIFGFSKMWGKITGIF